LQQNTDSQEELNNPGAGASQLHFLFPGTPFPPENLAAPKERIQNNFRRMVFSRENSLSLQRETGSEFTSCFQNTLGIASCAQSLHKC
jgi:hypothetical protein